MARFKDKMLDETYQLLVGKTPEDLLERKIFGSIYHAFKAGYDKLPMPHYIPRNTAGYAAYVAGKETPVTPVTKLTKDIWNSMTPMEREQLGVKAGLNAEERGYRWLELWPEQKRALIREFKKEQLAIPKAVPNKAISELTKDHRFER